MIIELVIFALVLLLTYYIWKRWQDLTLRDRMGVPGPKTNFLFGNMGNIKAANKTHVDHPMMIVKDWRKEYGNYFGFYIGPRLTVVLTDMELAKEVLIKQFNCFSDRMRFALIDRNVVKESLLHLSGDRWKHTRYTVTPAFSASKMKQMSSLINEKLDITLSIFDKFAEQNKSFDIYHSFQTLALDVICECAFSVKSNCQTDPNDPLLRLIHDQEFFKDVGQKDILLNIAVLFPELDWFWTKFRHLTKFGQVEQWLLNVLRKIVNERRQNYTAKDRVDYLQLLFEQQMKEDNEAIKNPNGTNKKWRLTDDAVLGNAFVIVLAGSETTSTALAFTAWLLAKHRDVQEKLQKEIDENVSDRDDVNYDTIHKLPYLDAVFHESLRVFPPVVQIITRTCVKECDVGPIHFVPGVQVNIPTREIHNDPHVWHEPEKFCPDRFLNSTFPLMSWLPFGVGPRNCIGMRFANMEYKMALVRILRNYNIVFGPDSENPLQTMENSLMLTPKNGVQIRVVKRLQKMK